MMIFHTMISMIKNPGFLILQELQMGKQLFDDLFSNSGVGREFRRA